MSLLRPLLLVVVLALLAPVLRAQGEDEDEPAAAAAPRVLAPSWKDQGAAAYAEKDWAQAIYLYRRWLEADPKDFETWYNLSCCYALAGLPEKALDALDTAVDAGWNDPAWPREDPDLTTLRADPRFEAALARAASRESPDAPSSFERHYVVQKTLGTYVAMLPPDYEATERDYPLVVILHGNGSTETQHGRLADALGRDGVIYVAPRAPYPNAGVFRSGKPGWTSRPDDADPEAIAAFDPAGMYVDTILAAVADAKSRYRIAGDRFFVLGHSMGGFFASTLAVLHPELVASCFAYAGGLPEAYQDPEMLARVAEMGVRAFHAHGRTDPVVPVALSQQAHEVMKAAGIDSTLLLFEDQDHGIGPGVRDAMKAWLDDVVRAAPRRAEAGEPEPEGRVHGIRRGAKRILDAALESMGGAAALGRIERMRVRQKGTYHSGPMQSAYEATLLWARGGNLRWEMTSPMFSGAMGVGAGRPWAAFGAPAAHTRGAMAASVDEWLLQQDALLVEPLLRRTDVAVTLGAGSPARSVVVVTRDDGRRLELHYRTVDGASRLAAVHGDQTQWDGSKGRFETEITGHATFGDVTLPAASVTRIYKGDALHETIVEETIAVDWNPELGADAFAMPAPQVVVDTPAIERAPAMTAIVLVHRGAYGTIDETIQKAQGLVADAGLMAAGPVVAVFVDDPTSVEDPADLRTEIVVPFVPMGPPPAAPEGAEIRTYPETEVAAITLRGAYGSVESAGFPKLAAWLPTQGKRIAGPPRQVYLHDPKCTVPEEQLSTVQFPVR